MHLRTTATATTAPTRAPPPPAAAAATFLAPPTTLHSSSSRSSNNVVDGDDDDGRPSATTTYRQQQQQQYPPRSLSRGGGGSHHRVGPARIPSPVGVGGHDLKRNLDSLMTDLLELSRDHDDVDGERGGVRQQHQHQPGTSSSPSSSPPPHGSSSTRGGGGSSGGGGLGGGGEASRVARLLRSIPRNLTLEQILAHPPFFEGKTGAAPGPRVGPSAAAAAAAAASVQGTTAAGLSFHAMISYAWKDHALVRPLVDSLIKMKFRVWIDVNNMGDQINEAMIDGIRGSAVVIPFISDSYVSSHNCKLEIKFANDIRKPILPVRLACSEAVLYSTAAFVTAGQLYIDLQSGVTQTSHRTVADRLAKLLSSVAPDLHPHYLQPMQQQQQQLVKVEETATAAGHLRWERANALLNLFDDHHREGKARMSEFLCSDSDARHCLTTFATAATETRQRLRAVRKLRTLERLARLSHYATAAMSSKSDKIPTPPSPVTVLCYGSATTLTLQFSAPMFTAWKLCAVLEQRRRFRAVTASDRCRPYLIAYPGMPRVSHLCHKCGGVVVICPIMEDDPTAREHIAESVLTHVERLNQLITRSKTASKLVAVLSTTLPEEDLTWVSKSGVSVDKEYVARYRRTSSRLHQFSTAQGGCNLAKILVAYIAGDHALTRVDPSDFGIWELAVLSAEPVVPYVQWAEGFARYRDGIEIDHSMTMARWDSLMRARQNCEARLSPLKMWSLFDQVVMGDKVEIGSDELSYYNVGKMAIIDDLGPKSVADKWLENEHVEVSVDAASGDLKFGGMNTESFAKLLGVEYKNPKGPRRAEESRIIVERMRECFLDTIGIETTCIALMESWQISRLASGTLAVKRVKNQWMRKIMRAVGVRNAVALLLGPLAAAAGRADAGGGDRDGGQADRRMTALLAHPHAAWDDSPPPVDWGWKPVADITHLADAMKVADPVLANAVRSKLAVALARRLKVDWWGSHLTLLKTIPQTTTTPTPAANHPPSVMLWNSLPVNARSVGFKKCEAHGLVVDESDRRSGAAATVAAAAWRVVPSRTSDVWKVKGLAARCGCFALESVREDMWLGG